MSPHLPPCRETKFVPQRKQVGRKVHCSSHNRTPEMRKLCLSHAHVLPVATVLLLYPVCSSHARSGISTKFILYFYLIFPTCTAYPETWLLSKIICLNTIVFLVVKTFHCLLWFSYNSCQYRAWEPKGGRWKGVAGHLFLSKWWQQVPKGLDFEERGTKADPLCSFPPSPHSHFSTFGLEEYKRSQGSPSTSFSNSTYPRVSTQHRRTRPA